MGTWFVTEGGCKYICKDMGWMWMENGPDSEITKFSKIIKYKKKRGTWMQRSKHKSLKFDIIIHHNIILCISPLMYTFSIFFTLLY